MLVFNAIISTLIEFITITIIVIAFNYLINKDFKKLIHKIKKIVLSNRKNRFKTINKVLYNYFFID